MDIRHPFKDSDRMMLDWCVDAEVPLHILLTKTDKLKQGAAKAVLLQSRKEVQEHAELVSVQLFSSLNGLGVEELREKLRFWLTEAVDDAETEEAETKEAEAKDDED